VTVINEAAVVDAAYKRVMCRHAGRCSRIRLLIALVG